MSLIGYSNNELLDNVFLKWHTFSEKEKLQLFVDNSCNELNFFIARKDPKFFSSHVTIYIANKVEWTFIDQYLLARYANDSECQQEMARILNSIVAFEKISMIEKALAIEYGVCQAGDDELRQKAISLAKNALEVFENLCKNEQQALGNEFQRQKIKLIDGILDMQNENKPKIDVVLKEKNKTVN